MRRVWLERWIVVGPAPKPISATDFSGTEPPLEVGTGKFSIVARSRRAFSGKRHAIGTWRSDSENLALFWSMSPIVAMRIVWLSAAVVTPRSAARSRRGLMMISGRSRSPPTRGARSSGSFCISSASLLAACEQFHRIVAAEDTA